jgi:hypothetical protein
MSGVLSGSAIDRAAPSAGAVRMARHRNRRRKQLRCIPMELRERAIDALIRRGLLSSDDRPRVGAGSPAPDFPGDYKAGLEFNFRSSTK